jgi:hypothetical protein
MSRTFVAVALALALGVPGSTAAFAQPTGGDPQAEASSWKQKAVETRAAVSSVAGELEALGDQDNAAARSMIDDAKRWLDEGDKSTTRADEKAGAGDWAAARNEYVAAWNHYVRAATSGLNAKRILTGE